MSTLKAKQFHLIEDLDIAALTLAIIERVENVSKATISMIRTWVRRSNDRRMLAQMNERMLSDIGLTRHDIDVEVAKRFWQK
ncbi:MAG: DUF1127 domain-containing protein [Gammaproteobacteria bacterium]|nr:DUF1127 domain-containing protein [Gammaproteobacteria bacterium]